MSIYIVRAHGDVVLVGFRGEGAGGWGRVLPVLALDDPILNVLSTLQIASGRAELFG